MPYRGQTIGGCPHPMCGNVQRVRYITSSTIWRTTVSDSYLPPPTQLVLPPKSCSAHPHPPRPLRYSDSPSKGKAPKALMYIGRAPPRGTKRSAASVVQAEEQADQGNDEARKKKTKRQKAGKSVSRRSVHVVIQSPKIPTRKRRRIEDTESSASEKSDEEEREEETSAEQWVGKGEARSITLLYCRYRQLSTRTNRTGVSGAGVTRLNIPVCEPQWHSKRSISCKACARRKTACKATNIWKQKVVLGDQELVLWNGPSCGMSGISRFNAM